MLVVIWAYCLWGGFCSNVCGGVWGAGVWVVGWGGDVGNFDVILGCGVLWWCGGVGGWEVGGGGGVGIGL